MGKVYNKNKLSISLTEYNKNGTSKRTIRRSSAKTHNLINTSKAKLFKIKIIYFANKDLINESIIGNKKYIKGVLSVFTSQSLVKLFESYMPNNYLKIDKQGNSF